MDAAHPTAPTPEIPSGMPAETSAPEVTAPPTRARIIFADDDAEMRAVVCAVLEEHYDIEAAEDGLAALDLIRAQPPALVLTDLMMPRLDGIGLVRALREDPVLREIPVIILTGSGDEPGSQGLVAGADDYLTKPFAPAELLARVGARLEIARLHREADAARQHASTILESITDGFCAFDRAWRFTAVNREAERLLGRPRAELLGRELWTEFPKAVVGESREAYFRALREQKTVSLETFSTSLGRWLDLRIYPNTEGISVFFRDVSRRKLAEEAAQTGEGWLRLMFESVKDYALFSMDASRIVTSWNPGAQRLFGYEGEEIVGRSCDLLFTPEDRATGAPEGEVNKAAEIGWSEDERWHLRKDGSRFFASGMVRAIRGADGSIQGFTKVARDETERMRDARALEESERRLRVLLDASPNLVATRSPDGALDFVNERWRTFTGSTPQELNARGRGAILHAEDLPRVLAAEEAAARRGEPYQLELRLRRADGAYRWAVCRVAPIRGADGEIAQWLETTMDVHDQHVQRRKLQFLDDLAEATRHLTHPVEIMGTVARRLGRHLRVSRCAYADVEPDAEHFTILHDYTDRCASTVGEYHLSLFGPRAVADLKGGRTLVIRDVQRELVPGAGAEMFQAIDIQAIICCPLVKVRGLSAMMAVHQTTPRDWTSDEVDLVEATVERSWAYLERARAESALRTSEERFRMMAENIAQFAWMADEKGWISWYNQRWFDYTGTTLEEMQGWGWRAVHHTDYVERVAEKFRRHIESGEVWEDTFPLRSKAGEYRWFLSRALPIRDEHGKVQRWFGTNTDITAQREAEAALREADRRKDEFLAMLAHELRNPLAAANNALALFEQSQDMADQQWAREVAQRQIGQLTHLVDDLLDVSRITSGKIRLRTALLDAAAVLDHAVQSVRPLVASRGHELSVAFPRDGSLAVKADAARLEQIVVNLLTNAAKYTENGGLISLEARRERTAPPPPPSSFSSSSSSSFPAGEALEAGVNEEDEDGEKDEERDELVITVRDSGLGIAPEKLPQMFDLFAQGERSIARSEGGLGLGLTIVKKLAELHGGTIAARSAGLGHGSEFTVRLPAQAASPDAQSPEAAQPPESLPRGARVLVVDDNLDTARGMSRLLKLSGYTVETAHDGPGAIALARRFHPEVMLLDIGLPGIDGYGVASTLRGDPWCAGAVIIAVSGYGQDEDRRRSQEAGFNHHLVKPVDYEELKALLRQHTAGRLAGESGK